MQKRQSNNEYSSFACFNQIPCQILTFGTEDDTMHAAFSCKVAASALTHMSLTMHGGPPTVIAAISHSPLPGPPRSLACVEFLDSENSDGEAPSADHL